jgi:hypothetical protein
VLFLDGTGKNNAISISASELRSVSNKGIINLSFNLLDVPGSAFESDFVPALLFLTRLLCLVVFLSSQSSSLGSSVPVGRLRSQLNG